MMDPPSGRDIMDGDRVYTVFRGSNDAWLIQSALLYSELLHCDFDSPRFLKNKIFIYFLK